MDGEISKKKFPFSEWQKEEKKNEEEVDENFKSNQKIFPSMHLFDFVYGWFFR